MPPNWWAPVSGKIRTHHCWTNQTDAEEVIRKLAGTWLEFEAKLVRTHHDYVSARQNKILAAIDSHIRAWSCIPAYAPLAEVLGTEKDSLLHILSSRSKEPDALRLFLLDYALERLSRPIDADHFVLFREAETVQVVLEDSFGVQPGLDRDEILIPHQNEAMKIIVQCLVRKKSGQPDRKDVECFLRLFAGTKPESGADQDRTIRFKSMVWFIYLAVEVIMGERGLCTTGLETFRNKFRELMDNVIEQTIIDEESRKPGFENGKWETTLFGWLQGEDRKQFVFKLKRQFNFENLTEHANRLLLSEHRKCVFEQVMALFC